MLTKRQWLIALALVGASACSGDDDDDAGGEGEGEMDAVLDILVDGAEGVLNGVHSVKASYLVSNATSCDGLTSRRVTPAEFENRRDPVVAEWDTPGNPHVIAEIANGSSQVLIETFESTDGSGEPTAAGCEDPVYVAPEQRLNFTITVRLNP